MESSNPDSDPESVPRSLIYSIINDYDTDILFDLSDSIITDSVRAIKDSDVLKNLPVTKEIIGLVKVGFAYQHRRFISKLLSFLGESSKMSEDDRKRFLSKLDEDPEKAQDAGEILLDILDKVTSTEKAVMIGKVIRAYGHEQGLTFDMMINICEIIQRTYLKDLQGLQQDYGYSETNLESVGIIKPMRHEDIEKVVKQAIQATEHMSPTIKDGLTPPPPKEPKIDRSGLTEEGYNLQRVLKQY